MTIRLSIDPQPRRFQPRRYRPANVIHVPGDGDFTAAFFGDPAPGRSALDAKRVRDAAVKKPRLPPLGAVPGFERKRTS